MRMYRQESIGISIRAYDFHNVKVACHGRFIDGKGLISRKVGKTGPIGPICHKNATNFSNRAGRAGMWGTALK
jgi:hypothetical protein